MSTITNGISQIVASAVSQPVDAPDSGPTALLLGAGIIGIAAVARFMKNRKK